MKNTKIINLFGGPGCGKSTIASGIFYELKKRHFSADLPYEFPKEVFWEENVSQISDQLFILANQHRGIVRAYGKVDFIILDSPILLSPIYRNNYSTGYPSNLYDENFDNFVLDVFNKYENLNFFLRRPSSDFQKEGRFQDAEGSKELDEKIIDFLTTKQVPFVRLPVNENTAGFITNYIIKLHQQG
jgi:hypothetical protein